MAGTNVGLRQNNEDNFTVCANLSKQDWGIPVNYQEEVELGERGAILVVADGMGGQNAGEVASSIAIQTVQEMFSDDVFPSNTHESNEAIDNYLKKVICEADARIKKVTREDSSTSGMGSTIVIVWVVKNLAHVAWLGDSRAYCIIKDKGIARLTKDHSYVQSLVDAGRITDEQAMNHPDSNIINRSLGDTSQKARPDVTSVELTEGEVILLCSDGLCGVCHDAVIGGIVEDRISDLKACREDLISAALSAGGSDNITIAMIHICRCGYVSDNPKIVRGSSQKRTKRNYMLYSIIAAFIMILVGMWFFMPRPVVSYKLAVEPNQIVLEDGKTRHLFAKYYTLVDGVIDSTKTQDVTLDCSWLSDVPDIVAVSDSGEVTAKDANSTFKIIAVYRDCKDTIMVKVKPKKNTGSIYKKEKDEPASSNDVSESPAIKKDSLEEKTELTPIKDAIVITPIDTNSQKADNGMVDTTKVGVDTTNVVRDTIQVE